MVTRGSKMEITAESVRMLSLPQFNRKFDKIIFEFFVKQIDIY